MDRVLIPWMRPRHAVEPSPGRQRDLVDLAGGLTHMVQAVATTG